MYHFSFKYILNLTKLKLKIKIQHICIKHKIIEMITWVFEDGVLSLGTGDQVRKGHNNTIMNYVPHKNILNSEQSKEYLKVSLEEFRSHHKKARDIYLTQMDYRMKISKNGQYCAVYANNHVHCDFFIQEDMTHPMYPGQKLGRLLFSLSRNMNEPRDYVIEFFEHPISHETVFIFNKNHGQISVYNMDGKIINSDDPTDHYVSLVEIINEKYLLYRGWVWHPYDICLLYDINQLITIPSYEPESIWMEGDYASPPIIQNGGFKVGDLTFDVESYCECKDLIKEFPPSILEDGKIKIRDLTFESDFFYKNISKIYNIFSEKYYKYHCKFYNISLNLK